ncbi:hypothetical protein QN386_22000 [Pseudomonas sp. CCI3.2]|uniref:hypothetical protein n=1 Tax=unclassified Pseudomonas TaxID=196821 RepID=UPI002AC8C4EE|nr:MULTISPECIES: hypothetical protein [unclassified Pseudomonas]MEB0078463.1 hypothetical protein [Pseudomonas sp. MH10out]MEB0090131.1 hypothetical protein [Pseudomonas sp. CCI4.2]MEB0103977.1 hypothetical protein [Pseudomonas sp. CCI3.2]MEB0131754.1 hypothetical protein [Pseudomonas sp. CCI2.4]MEB0158086.1 hypothetical protein [Pseudomonas sp. AH2 (2023)]
MKHTLVAAFDNFSDADKVRTELVDQGIAHTNITVAAAQSDSTSGLAAETSSGLADDASMSRVSGHDESMGEKISRFFSSLFGNDEDDNLHRHAVAYPEAYRRGSTLVTVTVDTDEQADEAEHVMERNGAIDINERSASWANKDLASTSGSYITPDTDLTAPAGLNARDNIPTDPVRVSRVSERPFGETGRPSGLGAEPSTLRGDDVIGQRHAMDDDLGDDIDDEPNPLKDRR